MTRVTVPATHQPEEPPAAFTTDEQHREIARLSTLVARLALLIEDTQGLGNHAAEYSLQVQYHQAAAELLRCIEAWGNGGDEALRRRHLERAAEFQARLDSDGETNRDPS
ncbi:hypothetical protein [Halomonas koreensis]|uniref:Uncharacterized protein n=1 Tax=Halomonas koreensis TaxID=245385 RepID=A0ABU1G3Z5_9GAMM|nr:hypothetical protein [Halomonas koreensis]MDR5867273.1 hypothetical protein [Halomonas koreensis]